MKHGINLLIKMDLKKVMNLSNEPFSIWKKLPNLIRARYPLLKRNKDRHHYVQKSRYISRSFQTVQTYKIFIIHVKHLVLLFSLKYAPVPKKCNLFARNPILPRKNDTDIYIQKIKCETKDISFTLSFEKLNIYLTSSRLFLKKKST